MPEIVTVGSSTNISGVHEVYATNNKAIAGASFTQSIYSKDGTGVVAGVGGGIAIGGKLTGGSYEEYAFIEGVKETNVSGNSKGNLILKVRNAVGTAVEGMRIYSGGGINMANLPTSAPATAGDIWNNAGVLTIV
jgi:hypothetical protein